MFYATPGTYQSEPGNDTCVQCPAGNECNTTSATVCQAGTVSKLGQTTCTVCQQGIPALSVCTHLGSVVAR